MRCCIHIYKILLICINFSPDFLNNNHLYLNNYKFHKLYFTFAYNRYRASRLRLKFVSDSYNTAAHAVYITLDAIGSRSQGNGEYTDVPFYCIAYRSFCCSLYNISFTCYLSISHVHTIYLTWRLFFKGVFSMIVLKNGSTNIYAKEIAATYNWIGKCYIYEIFMMTLLKNN